ncbi:sugar transferase (plasmid) [Sulfitobacter sp. TCYB15]|uniref:Sugar transferase n=1 Tax=Sulfitobacter sp. TCYB15 TaxID=3229275 RepID=A0AAU8C8C8_9RHOB
MIRLFDILFALLMLAAAGLPMLLIAVAIVLHDGFPVIFRQTRVGRGGDPFTIFKFRSMRKSGPESSSGEIVGQSLADKQKARAAFQTTQVGDERITPVGRVIRKTHLDELPQIFNVLRGDMSVVGVRPDTPAQEVDYDPAYWQTRHIYRPGITGPAQVGHTSGGIPQRCFHELTWLEGRSVKLYLLLLLRTVVKVGRRNSF